MTYLAECSESRSRSLFLLIDHHDMLSSFTFCDLSGPPPFGPPPFGPPPFGPLVFLGLGPTPVGTTSLTRNENVFSPCFFLSRLSFFFLCRVVFFLSCLPSFILSRMSFFLSRFRFCCPVAFFLSWDPPNINILCIFQPCGGFRASGRPLFRAPEGSLFQAPERSLFRAFFERRGAQSLIFWPQFRHDFSRNIFVKKTIFRPVSGGTL